MIQELVTVRAETWHDHGHIEMDVSRLVAHISPPNKVIPRKNSSLWTRGSHRLGPCSPPDAAKRAVSSTTETENENETEN